MIGLNGGGWAAAAAGVAAAAAAAGVLAFAALDGKRRFFLIWRAMSAGVDAQLADAKAGLLAGAPHVRGVVLDVGAGLGTTFKYLPPAVERVVAVEPNAHMHAGLRAAGAAAGFTGARLDVLAASADALPLPDASVDTVVAVLVLCSVPAPAAAVAELYRVLKPGGALVFLEHVAPRAAHDGAWAALEARLLMAGGFWPWLGDGCHLDRATDATIRAQPGWARVEVASRIMPYGPLTAAARRHVLGVAIKA